MAALLEAAPEEEGTTVGLPGLHQAYRCRQRHPNHPPLLLLAINRESKFW
jgi:hypothetical protein